MAHAIETRRARGAQLPLFRGRARTLDRTDAKEFSPWLMGCGERLRGDRDAMLVALYLQTAPTSSATGIFELRVGDLASALGMLALNAAAALERVCIVGFAHYEARAGLVWLPEAAAARIGDRLCPTSRRHVELRRELSRWGDHIFVRAFIERYGDAYALRPPAADRTEAQSTLEVRS